jgi:hypothetical protein
MRIDLACSLFGCIQVVVVSAECSWTSVSLELLGKAWHDGMWRSGPREALGLSFHVILLQWFRWPGEHLQSQPAAKIGPEHRDVDVCH